ncbi:amino acid adenylation domain-containing protein [Streptomyces sp. NPDC050759]|uniref:amino acid adenylation domain-containing protein n=1 Tax=Streptomyces sp. NPDC050759 TaxID=3365635 RepID=UPI0037B31FE7
MNYDVSNIQQIHALTALQQGILFHGLLDDHEPLYVAQYKWTVRGPLDLDAFEEAWRLVIQRHDTLRTSFEWEGIDQPAQVVWRDIDFALDRREVSELSGPEQRHAIDSYLKEDLDRGYQLSVPPLYRVAVFRLDDETSEVVWSFHHLLFDGWSMQTVFADLAEFYAALTSGRTANLPEPAQYRKYLEWLDKTDLTGAEDYWRETLSGYEPSLLSGSSEGIRYQTDGSRHLSLPAETLERIRGFAAKQRVTVNTVVSAAWGLLISRYCGTDDIVFGLSAAERPAELEDADRIVGVMLNSVPARIRIRPGQTIGDWLREIQADQVRAREYGRAPLTDIHAWAGLPGNVPLFQTMVAFENYPLADSTEIGGVNIGAVEYKTRVNYPLTLIVEFSKTIDFKFNFSTDLFDAETVDRLLEHFGVVLEAVVGDGDCRVSDVDVLSVAERSRLVGEWNATGAEFPSGSTVVGLFEEQVARAGGALAVVCGGERVSFGGLNVRANRLAWRLRELGVGPEVVVGVCLPRGVDAVVAVLGVMKAGGVYAPLDPEYPGSRLAFMLADTGARVVVSDAGCASVLPEHDAVVVRLDEDAPQLAGYPEGNPEPLAGPESLAYIIYTSGSTGTPKGVEVPHQGVVNYLMWWVGIISGQGNGGVSHYSLSFDTTVRDTFCPLLAGQTLHILPEHEKSVFQAKPFLEKKERLSYLKVTPSELAAEEGLTAADVEKLTGIVIVGGEAVTATPLITELTESRKVRIANHYGPTECSIGATFAWTDETADTGGPLPIGRPLANTSVYVLDERMRLAPVGVPGELYIGGVGVSRGYRGRPGLTAQRFVPDPFGERPGARLYRTGDLVRYRPDGQLEFLGRLDHQVKVRGHRIELGEIESVLLGHPEVANATVIVREDLPGDRRLVGYVVCESTGTDLAALRSYVRERLPGYMVPSVIVELPEIPLMPSRKVDRSRLPVPEAERPDVSAGYVAPTGPVQEVLAGIWADLLGLDRVGAEDDFFELGGHSLLVTRVMSRVRDTFDVEVPFGALFDAPTVAGLADVIERLSAGDGTSEGPELPPVVPVSRDEPLPLAYPQQRLWFLDQLIPDNPFYNLPAAYRIKGRLDVAALHRAVTTIVHRHEVLRTSFPPAEGGRPVQVVQPAGDVPMPVVEVPGETEDEVLANATALTEEEAARTFDLAAGPVFRSTLLRLSATDHVLVLVLHHMVGDGWSSSLLAKELNALYGAYCVGEETPLAPLPVQYGDYAVWQRGWLTDEEVERQLAYWRKQLTGMPPVLELPADRVRPAVSSYQGGTRFFTVRREVTDGLKRLAREERATLYMVLLAAFKVLMVRYTRQTDVVVGTPVANRRRAELEDLVGFFINTLVLRTDCSGDPSFRELLGRVRETTLGAYTHQDLPFERLVTEIAPPRDLSRNPMVQVGFQLQNMPMELLELPEAQSSFFMTGKLTTHLDAEVYLTEVPLDVVVPEEMLGEPLSPDAGEDLSGGLYGRMVFSTDLFDAETVDRLLEHFGVVLEAVVGDGDCRVSDVDVLSVAERSRLVGEWNATGAEFPSGSTVVGLFEEQVARAGGALAVVCGGERVSFGGLNVRANRLAWRLRELGVGPEVVVGVCLPRGVDAVVALLAVMKAGGVYAPLDPEYPGSRLAFMLADTGARVVVSDAGCASVLPEHDAVVVRLDEDAPQLAGYPEGNPEPLAGPESLAYIIYTSGSTGTPKGVEVPHQGLTNLVCSQGDLFQVGPGSRSTNAFGAAFDAALSATVMPLARGATLYIQPPEEYRYGADLARHIEKNEITALHLPVSVLKSLPEGDLPSLRSIGTGAEAVAPELVRRWAGRLRMFNAYGPTETTVVSVMGKCAPEMANSLSVPIGRPLANTSVYVLDERMRLAPVGVPGELYIGGVGVSRGYRGRPGLTAQRFVPDPFGERPGARLYRTGDLVRYRPDGVLEFLGRLDDQVKVRGHRIELGEIEAALGRHPDVANTVVVVDEKGPMGARLVAFVVLRDATAEISDLRPFLRDVLPGYMIPSLIVPIAEIPLLATGKVDRSRLPSIEGIQPELTAGYVAPDGPVQTALAEIWADLLGLTGVGIHDDFFELGGHSMLIINMIWQIKQRFGVEVAFADVFESPAIADLAERVGELLAEKEDESSDGDEPGGDHDGASD